MRKKIILSALLALAAVPAAADDMGKYLEESRAIIGPFAQQLQAENKKAIKEGGPDSAIKVCKDIAPKMAGDLSRQHGIKLTRVSLKVRNPLLGTADEWEQKTLKQFEERIAKGEKPETLEAAEIVTEPARKYYRFMKGIVMQKGCLGCHGSADVIDENVKARLAEDYPHDRATGYAEGQVRGGISIKRPL
ncbi:MAG: DUF3365 domain-containing protein [Sideroxyarcus sp.]|nr:DUF3365 domain-containing protein [Sideroxyarcus sp.]